MRRYILTEAPGIFALFEDPKRKASAIIIEHTVVELIKGDENSPEDSGTLFDPPEGADGYVLGKELGGDPAVPSTDYPILYLKTM